MWPHTVIYVLSVTASRLPRWTWVVVTEISELTAPEIFAIWRFIEKKKNIPTVGLNLCFASQDTQLHGANRSAFHNKFCRSFCVAGIDVFSFQPPSGPSLIPYSVAYVLSQLQFCLILGDPVDCSPPGSPGNGILQARILEWAAMSSSRGSSRPRDRTSVSCLLHWQAGSLPLEPCGSLVLILCGFCIMHMAPQILCSPLRTLSISGPLADPRCPLDRDPKEAYGREKGHLLSPFAFSPWLCCLF